MAAIVSVGSHGTTDITLLCARRVSSPSPRVVACRARRVDFEQVDLGHQLRDVVAMAFAPWMSESGLLVVMSWIAVSVPWGSSKASSCRSIGASEASTQYESCRGSLRVPMRSVMKCWRKRLFAGVLPFLEGV